MGAKAFNLLIFGESSSMFPLVWSSLRQCSQYRVPSSINSYFSPNFWKSFSKFKLWPHSLNSSYTYSILRVISWIFAHINLLPIAYESVKKIRSQSNLLIANHVEYFLFWTTLRYSPYLNKFPSLLPIFLLLYI